MGAVTTVPPSMFGVPALRTEDPRFLRGEGRYLDNVDIPGALRAVFVRSMMPHAELGDIGGLDEARALPGVVGVFTADDLALPLMPPAGNVETPDAGDLADAWSRAPLARGRVRFAGEPFGVVVAETLARALPPPGPLPLDAIDEILLLMAWFRAHPEALRRTTPLAEWNGGHSESEMPAGMSPLEDGSPSAN